MTTQDGDAVELELDPGDPLWIKLQPESLHVQPGEAPLMDMNISWMSLHKNSMTFYLSIATTIGSKHYCDTSNKNSGPSEMPSPPKSQDAEVQHYNQSLESGELMPDAEGNQLQPG